MQSNNKVVIDMCVSVIIAASGRGTRLGGDMPKQFQQLLGKPVLAYTLGVFNCMDTIDDITIAVPADYVTHTQEIVDLYGFKKVTRIIPGGANRAESVYAALKQLSTTTEVVLIHDGVRPFVTDELITATITTTRKHGTAVVGTVLTDTLKQVNEKGQVIKTPDRRHFWRVQTPQGFGYELLMKAYKQGETDDILAHVTDDSQLVERLGIPVQMVEGSPRNIKITTPEDLELCKQLLNHKTR